MVTWMLGEVTVRIYAAREHDAFVLSLSKAGDMTLGAWPGGAETWRTVQHEITRLSLRRGGDVDGVTPNVDVGRATFTMVAYEPPMHDARLLVGRPVEILARTTAATPQVIFSGRIADIDVEFRKGDDKVLIHVAASDAVDALANTPRYGAVTPRNASTEIGGPSIPADTGYNRWRRLMASAPDSIEWTGKGETPAPIPYLIVTPQSTWRRWGDFVSIWKDTQNIGTFPLEPLGPNGIFVADTPRNNGSVRYNALERGVEHDVIVNANYPYVFAAELSQPDAVGIDDPAVARYRVGVNGTWGDAISINAKNSGQAGDSVAWAAYTPAGNRATMQIARDFTGTVSESELWNAEALEIVAARAYRLLNFTMPDVIPCQNVVYESTLANHLTLWSNTTQRYWYVRQDGAVVFSDAPAALPAPTIVSSDEHRPHDTPDTAWLSPTAMDISYGTEGIVNALEITNHGRQPGDAPGEYIANDVTTVFEDTASIGAYGRRVGTLDTCAPAPFLTPLARAHLDRSAQPKITVRKVTYDMTDHRRHRAIELHQVVLIAIRGEAQHYTVVGIEHTVSHARWTVTLTLWRR